MFRFGLTLVLCLNSCVKKKDASGTVSDRIVGTWHLGSEAQFCLPVPHTNTYFYTEQQVIRRGQQYYNYDAEHRIFTDKACTNLAILQKFQGNYSLGGELKNKSDTKRTVYTMTHARGNFTAQIFDGPTLNRANLMTAEGLQGGMRFCAMKEDWVLGKRVNITDAPCSLGLVTKTVNGGQNILGLSNEEAKLQTGADVSGAYVNYPIELIEQGIKEWYKLTQ